MKKLATLIALMPFAATVFGQAITINTADMPVPTASYNILDITTSAAANPVRGTNATWAYTTYTGGLTFNAYSAETDTAFSNHGVDVYTSSTKTLTPGFSYLYNSEIDFNTTNVKVAALKIDPQTYDLSSFTMHSGDSLYFPAQHQFFTTPTELFHFGATAGSTWSSISTRSVNFTLTVFPTLTNTPGQHKYDLYRTDSIIGWGKMRVYTPGGPSIAYDVLMDKISSYAVDSFFLGGSPAPTSLLTTFQVTQGQHTDSSFRYNFYRKGSFNYLLSFYFGTDATYTLAQGKFQHTDNLITSGVGVNGVANGAVTTVVFPNPSTGNEVNMMLAGATATEYCVTDLTGKTIQAGAVTMKNGAVNIAFDTKLNNGNYIIALLNAARERIATEQFIVAQ